MVLFTLGIIPDIRSLLPVPNFPNMINSTQLVRPSQPVAYSFPSPFPGVRFKECAKACYRPTLSQGFPVKILRMISKLSSFRLYRSSAFICPSLHGSQHAAPHTRTGLISGVYAKPFVFLYPIIENTNYKVKCLPGFCTVQFTWSTQFKSLSKIIPKYLLSASGIFWSLRE